MIITQIENAMIERIKAVNSVPNFGNLLKTVDRYSGEFATENMALAISMAPFVLLSHTRSMPLAQALTGTQWVGEFTILCGATSRRTQAMSSRVGGVSDAELGSRPIAELVRDILHGQALGLAITAIEPVALDEIYSGEAGGQRGDNFFSVTGLQVTTRYSTTRSPLGIEAGEGLATIVATFMTNLPGGAVIDDPDNNTVSLSLAQEGNPS